MKLILILAVATATCVPAAAQGLTANSTASDLRMSLLQKPPAGQDASRQLSPEQRAELRKQLGQFSRAGGKAP